LRRNRNAARVATSRDETFELHRTCVGRLRDHRDPCLTSRTKRARVDAITRLALFFLRGIEQPARVAAKRLIANGAKRIADERIELRALRNARVDVDEVLELRLQVTRWRRRINGIAKQASIHAKRRQAWRRLHAERRIERRRFVLLFVVARPAYNADHDDD